MTSEARKRAHSAWRERLVREGGTHITLALSAAMVRTLDAYRLPDESRPAALKRLLTELTPR